MRGRWRGADRRKLDRVSRMHILLFNEYYPPDTSATAKIAALVAEKLAERHRVTVVAGRPSYDPEEHYPYALLRRNVRNNLTIERVGSTDYPRHRMPRRVLNYLSYLALAIPRALSVRADLIVGMTDPPVAGIAAALVSRLTGRPFVYNTRDLYPDMAIGGDLVRRTGWVRQWERLHRWALRRAARVIVLGDDMRERILAKGIHPEKVVVIRDGVAPFSSTPAPDNPVTRQIRCGFSFVVLHAGNLGFYGAWDNMVKAAEILKNEDVGFVFVGDGANSTRLEEAARDRANVRVLPFRPASEIPYVMAAGDLHVVTVKRELEGVVVPSKLYTILASGRPVLVVAPPRTDAARIVQESRCGFVADPDDPVSIANAIREVRRQPERLAEMGERARICAGRYTRSAELGRFLEVVEQAAQTSPVVAEGGHADKAGEKNWGVQAKTEG
jgi:colanic acid biosynthesis glycosyl transferase WcaI